MLEELHRKGRTIIMVTHNQELATKTTRTLRLKDGFLQNEAVAA